MVSNKVRIAGIRCWRGVVKEKRLEIRDQKVASTASHFVRQASGEKVSTT
jgi:ribosomal protein S13